MKTIPIRAFLSLIIFTFILAFSSHSRAQLVTDKLWPGGILPFEFDQNVLPDSQARMLEAMAEWEDVASINFIQCPNNDCAASAVSNYLHIQNSDENQSDAGMQGGFQDLNIRNWRKSTILHELGHALGLKHEQVRLDRDLYVWINWNNIRPEKRGNFEIFESAEIYPKRNYGLPDSLTYDFASIMHYHDFSTCISPCPGPTIMVLPPNQAWQDIIGERRRLSHLDTLRMSFMYPEDDWVFVDKLNGPAPGYSSGSFSSPHQLFGSGVVSVPENGTVWVQPGVYNETGTFTKSMTFKAPLGAVTIGASQSTSLRGSGTPSALLAQSNTVMNNVAGSTENMPEGFNLEQNYPNPFNPSTTIKYALQKDVHTSLKIYNMLGQEVRTLVNERQSAGYKQAEWDGTNDFGQPVASGMYIYRLVAGSFIENRKMMMLK